MSIPTAAPRRRRATWALAAVAAMVASTVSLLAPAAQAEEATAPAFHWKVSDYFATAFSLKAHELADGATQDDDGVVTFPDGVGSYNAANGSLATTYDGSVTASLTVAGTEQYHITIADPRVVLDADGEGFVSAVVSAASIAQGEDPAASTDPKRVIVTTFDADAGDFPDEGRSSVTATPDWAGVLAADSQAATDLGIGAGKPVDDASFAPEFLAQLTPGVRAFFYQSKAGQDTKAPATFTAEADPIVVTPTVTDLNPETGLVLRVTGAGFTADTKAGDAGVYVGLAPAGGLPDVSSQDGMSAFAAATWVSAGALADGTFDVTLTSPFDALDPTTPYAVYTWQAHTHSNSTQDTETPVRIDFDSMRIEPDLTVTGPAKARFGTSAKFRVAVPGGTGKVTLRVAGKSVAKKLTAGRATLALPRNVGVGKRTVTVRYGGDPRHLEATETAVLRVTKGKAKVLAKVTRKAKVEKPGRLRVRATSAAGAPAPNGKVRIVLTKGKAKRVVKRKLAKSGKVTLTLPRLTKGAWRAKVTYLGSGKYAKATRTVTVKVKK